MGNLVEKVNDALADLLGPPDEKPVKKPRRKASVKADKQFEEDRKAEARSEARVRAAGAVPSVPSVSHPTVPFNTPPKPGDGQPG